MIIGLMRNFNKPSYTSKLTAMLSKYHDIDIIYIRPKDVNMVKHTISGKMFVDNKWISVETELPKFIDISPYCFKVKNKKIMNYLRKNTLLSNTNENLLGKIRLQEELLKDEEFSHLVIPTFVINNRLDDLYRFIEKNRTVVLKPARGERGKGVYILNKKDGKFKLGFKKKESKLTLDELEEFLQSNILSKRYIVQKYISSRTIQGDPFDCRVHVEKNGSGKWEVARMFIRIGIGQKVISNINQGGGISDLKPFLKSNFPDKWQQIIERLNNLATTLPYKLEEIRDVTVMTVGFDIGINKDGDLYIFEANSAPTTAPLKAEAVMLRVGYYKYIMEKLISESIS